MVIETKTGNCYQKFQVRSHVLTFLRAECRNENDRKIHNVLQKLLKAFDTSINYFCSVLFIYYGIYKSQEVIMNSVLLSICSLLLACRFIIINLIID